MYKSTVISELTEQSVNVHCSPDYLAFLFFSRWHNMWLALTEAPSNDAAATGSLEECCWPISECRRKMLLSNRWMLSPAWIAPLWMSLSSAYIFSLVLALFALPVASYSACSACANLCAWCSALVLAGALCCLLVWCSALLVLVLLGAQISSLVIHFLPQQPPNPPHNCKLLKHCLYFPAFSYSCLALCSEDWTFFATTFFPPNIEQPVSGGSDI